MESVSSKHLLAMVGAHHLVRYTSGGDNRVNHASPLGVADILITLDGDYICTTYIEALWVSDACLLHRNWL